MGCDQSGALGEGEELNSHKIRAEKYEKETNVDYSKNPNSFLAGLKNVYKNQEADTQPFNDTEFPPNERSLSGQYGLPISKSKIVWKSAKDIWGDDVKIISDPISLEDIKLGKVKDAYFVSVMSSLAEFPNTVLQLFKNPSMDLDGNSPIEVCLKIEGKWQVVLLDDKFPFDEETNKPIFSDSPSKRIWGVILEKAWAKINGGYGNIEKGYPREVFQVFTPYTTIPISVPKENKDSLWDNIVFSDKNNAIMTCTIKEGTEGIEKVGLIKNHSFSLVSAQEEEYNNEKIKLLKLRNPFGEGEWTGDYSDNSDKWNDELKNKFGFEGAKDDGIFFIEMNDFVKYFQVVTICIPTKGLRSTCIEIPENEANDYHVYRLKLNSKTVMSFSVEQPNPRFHKDVKKDLDIIENLVLAKINGDKLECVDSAYNETMSSAADPGEYILYFNLDFKTSGTSPMGYNLSVFGNKDFQMKKCEPDNNLDLLKSIMIPYIESMEKYQDKMNAEFVYFTGNRFAATALGFAYMYNKGEKTKYCKPYFAMKNFKAIGGEPPKKLKLPKDQKFLWIFNRIKAGKPFQTGIGAGIQQNEIAGAEVPKIPYKPPEQYTESVEYEEMKYDFKS